MRNLVCVVDAGVGELRVPVVHINNEGKAFCLLNGKIITYDNNVFVKSVRYELE